MCDSQVVFCAFRSIRNKFLLTRSMAEKYITLSDGNQKMLSTKTLSRKATSCSTKVNGKPVVHNYMIWVCLMSDQSGSVMNFPLYIRFSFPIRQRQTVEEPLLHSGGKRLPAHLLWEWKESNQTQRADRSECVLCVWCAWQSIWQVRSEITEILFECYTFVRKRRNLVMNDQLQDLLRSSLNVVNCFSYVSGQTVSR